MSVGQRVVVTGSCSGKGQAAAWPCGTARDSLKGGCDQYQISISVIRSPVPGRVEGRKASGGHTTR